MEREDYRQLRETYEPVRDNCKAIFIFESPPKDGAYFYDEADAPGNQLFYAMMRQILGRSKQSAGQPKQRKAGGLRDFADAGYLLIDATYQPINEGYSDSEKDEILKRDLPVLIGELDEYTEAGTKIIVGKVNVCEFLVPELKKLGRFNVLNGNENVRLPLNGNQTHFGKMVRPMLGLLPLEDT